MIELRLNLGSHEETGLQRSIPSIAAICVTPVVDWLCFKLLRYANLAYSTTCDTESNT